MSLLKAAASGISPERSGNFSVECANVGVRFSVGTARDDVKSRIHRILRRETGGGVHWALRGVDLRVHAGEILGVIGPNGAGKSTLCKVLTGLIRPDEGTATVQGDVAALLTFGTGFRLELTGRENVYLNGMMLGMSKAKVRSAFEEIVDFAGVARFIDQPMKKYSTGMRARLGFSVAALMEPEILIVDEALSVGDLEFFERAGRKIQEMIRTCKLVVVVTHRLEFVEEICTRAVWLQKGECRSYGLPKDVVNAYRMTVKPRPPKKKEKVIELAETVSSVGSAEVVSANGVTVQYALRSPRGRRPEPFRALDDVSFRVFEGDIVGVIGPNGAGKTTLCKVLAGILRPDLGTSSVKGEVTALLSFGTGFNVQLSGRDNIYLNGMMLGMRRNRIRDLCSEIVDFAEIGRYIDEPVKSYSNGMKSRLGFSIAAILRPNVFIIDEAMNAGDADFYSKASAKIQELITKARAVIVVTHNLSFVERVCTRGLWLHGGKLMFDGDAKAAVGHYRDTIHRSRKPARVASR